MKPRLLLALAPLLFHAACMSDPADDPPPGDDETALDDDASIPDDPGTDQLGPGEAELVPDITPEIALGKVRLHATAANLEIFRHGCYHVVDGLSHLDWSCRTHLDGAHAHFAFKADVSPSSVEVADNHGGYWGECVSLVKAGAKSDYTTSEWSPGAKAMAGTLPSGTALATFVNGHYVPGHALFLLSYITRNDKIVGMRVADQNWLGRTVKRHIIYAGTSGSVADANAYRAILVP